MGVLVKHRFILGLVALAISICAWNSNAFASGTTQTLRIAPSIVSDFINPGANANGSISVTNQSNSIYIFNAYATPYSVTDENYDPTFLPVPGKTNVSDWFKLQPTKGLLSSNQSTTINYIISVPPHTEPGGYYGAIFVQTNPLKLNSSAKNALNINERIGALFYIEIAGPLNRQGNLVSWQTNFLQKPPINSTIRVNNTGDIHYVSSINVTYSDIFGNPKYSYTTQKIVIPDTIRRINIVWPHAPSFGLFKVKGTVTIYGTVRLSSEYVLVISSKARIVALVIVLLIIGLIILKLFYHPRKYSMRSNRRSKDI